MNTSRLNAIKDGFFFAIFLGYVVASTGLIIPGLRGSQGKVLEAFYFDEQKKVIQQAVENARDRSLNLVADLRSRGFSLADARTLVLQVLGAERFGVDGYGYFFVFDADGSYLLHPLSPSLVGRPLSQTLTPRGRNLGQIFAPFLKKEGFVDYDWTVPRNGRTEAKTSYLLWVPELGWTLGTGFYHSDLAPTLAQFSSITDSAIGRLQGGLFLVLLGILPILFLLSALIHRRIRVAERDLHHQLGVLEQYRLILDKTSLVSRTDSEGVILDVNETLLQTTGYTREQMLGHSHNIERHPDTPLESFRDLWDTIQSGRVWTGVLKNRRADGSSYIKQASIVPLTGPDGKIEYLSSGQDITALVDHAQELENAFHTDPVTGLGSRIRLLKDVGQAMDPGVLLVDIAGFSSFNRNFGPAVADGILRQLASKLLDFSRIRRATAYRIQADTFALCFDAVDSADFDRLTKELLDQISQWSFDMAGAPTPLIFHLGGARGGQSSFLYADLALNRAKETNQRIFLYRPGDEGSAPDHLANLALLTQIDLALKNNRVYPVFQPILDLETGKVGKYECLMRIEDDRGKTLSPETFLELSKKTNLYHQLTLRVLEFSIEAFTDRKDEFSINLTIEDLMDASTVSFLIAAALRRRVADRLIIEVVETEELRDPGRTFRALDDLRAAGMRIAVDDFGAGYSNFDYLLKLNPSYVKIDQSITQNLLKDERARGLLFSVVQFAKTSGMKTIAEYIDSPELLAQVKSVGVDFAQGWLIGKPGKSLSVPEVP
jgi:PAS domain S-box-containing protein